MARLEIAFHTDSGLIAVADGQRRELKLVSLREEQVVHREPFGAEVVTVKDMQFSPNGNHLAVLCEAGSWSISAQHLPPIRILLYNTKKLNRPLPLEGVWGYAFCWSVDSRRIIWAGRPLDAGRRHNILAEVDVASGTLRTILETNDTLGEIGFVGERLVAWRLRSILDTANKRLIYKHALVQLRPQQREILNGQSGPAWAALGSTSVLATRMYPKSRSRVQSWRTFETEALYLCDLARMRRSRLAARFAEPIAVEQIRVSPDRERVALWGVVLRQMYGVMVGQVSSSTLRLIVPPDKQIQLGGWCSNAEVLLTRGNEVLVVDVQGHQRRLDIKG